MTDKQIHAFNLLTNSHYCPDPEDEPAEWDSGYDADTHEYGDEPEGSDDSGYDADTIPF